MTWRAKPAMADLFLSPGNTMRTLFIILLALASQGPTLAQAPGISAPAAPVTSSPLDVALEAQPPEQSGQAQQLMKEARVELERAADGLAGVTSSAAADPLLTARDALDQFDQSLEQLDQSIPGYVPRDLADMLHEQVSRAMALLQSDRAAAALLMYELALRVTDLTAEADLLIGRMLLGPDGQVLGNISNVLISAKGRTLALVVDRTGAGKNHQFTVDWADVTVKGTSLSADLSQADAVKLPDYIAR